MSYETLTAEVEDGLLTLTLNRPDRLNAVNTAMICDYLDALDAADRDDDVRAVIVSTAPGGPFAPGRTSRAGRAPSTAPGRRPVHATGTAAASWRSGCST